MPVCSTIQQAVMADRHAFFTGFFQNFYNTDVLLGKRVSKQADSGELKYCRRAAPRPRAWRVFRPGMRTSR